MSNDFLCCTGARLSGQVLSGLDRGGAAWSVELQNVRRLVYSERRTRNSTIYSLRLKDKAGWHTISVDIPRVTIRKNVVTATADLAFGIQKEFEFVITRSPFDE